MYNYLHCSTYCVGVEIQCTQRVVDESEHASAQDTSNQTNSASSGHSRKRKRTKIGTPSCKVSGNKISSGIRWTKSRILAQTLRGTSIKKNIKTPKSSRQTMHIDLVTPSGTAKSRSVPTPTKPMVFSIKTSPAAMVECIQNLNEEQKEVVREMGFGGLLGMKLVRAPTKLAKYLVEHLDDRSLVINTPGGRIGITPELVHEVFGVPIGGFDIDNILEEPNDSDLVKSWLSQFPKKKEHITKAAIVNRIVDSGDSGILFKLNFITLFANVICKSYKTGWCMTNIVNVIAGCPDIPSLDWCLYIQNCLKGSKKKWSPNRKRYGYSGPVILLIVSYYF